jgi:hypothetical protein
MSAQDKIKSSQKSFSRRGLLKFLSYFSFSQLMQSFLPLKSFAGGFISFAFVKKNSSNSNLTVDDVFSIDLYKGNSGTQTITNGVNLLNQGGLVWIKSRNDTTIAGHCFYDTARGGNKFISSSGDGSTSASAAEQTLTSTDTLSFQSNGWSLGTGPDAWFSKNKTGYNYASWTFRKAPNFFDIVLYTGDGVSGKTVSHNLGCAPGMIVIKRRDAASVSGWPVWHRSATGDLLFNTSGVQAASFAKITGANSTAFTLSTDADVNFNTGTYVAYLFAHDPGADSMIKCDTFTGTGSLVKNSLVVNIGFEPQFVLTKDISSSSDGSWAVVDCMRGPSVDTKLDYFRGQTTGIEESSYNLESFYSKGLRTGNTSNAFVNQSGCNYVYVAIRRSTKIPSAGTKVFNPVVYGNGGPNNEAGYWPGFAPDIHFELSTYLVYDRIRGNVYYLASNSTAAEVSHADTFARIYGKTNYGFEYPSDGAGRVALEFKRAKGFLDIVCDTGTGAAHTIDHNLTVAPEFIIRKSRSATNDWVVWHKSLANTEKLILNSTAAKATDTNAWNSTSPSATTFTVGTAAAVNTSAATYVTYMFATLAGISYVGSYTGDGSSNGSKIINCNFNSTARLIIIKRLDSTSDWFIWNSLRGINSGAADPYFTFANSSEVSTDDCVDPHTSGFIVKQSATAQINISGASYIFFAVS